MIKIENKEVRNAYKFAVKVEGELRQDYEALIWMIWGDWADQSWEEHIPTLSELKLTSGADDPYYVFTRALKNYYEIYKEEVATKKEFYLEAMQAEYGDLKFVLTAYNDDLGWFELDEPDNPYWMEFIDRTIYWGDKGRIMAEMVGLNLN